MLSRTNQRRVAVLLLLFLVLSVLVACSDSEDDKGKIYTIGLVNWHRMGEDAVNGFTEGLAAEGFIEGVNVTYFRLIADNMSVNDMIEAEPDLMYCVTLLNCLGVKRVQSDMNSDVPVIFALVEDPLEIDSVDYLISNWEKPEGNFTGVVSFSKEEPTEGQLLNILLQISPSIERVYIPYDPDEPVSVIRLEAVQEAAEVLNVELIMDEVKTQEDMAMVPQRIPDDIDAILHFAEFTFTREIAQDLIQVAITRKLPIAVPIAVVELGATVAYSPGMYSSGYQASRMAVQALNGIEIGTLPVEIANSELVINLDNAEAIGLEIDESVLQRAERLIRKGKSETKVSD